MMTFINMDADGVVILPTHRVVHGLKNFRAEELAAKAAPWFEVEHLAAGDTDAALARLAALRDQTAFVAAAASDWLLLKAKPEAVAQALTEISPRQRQLDVVQLHALVLERVLGIGPEAVRDETHLRYLRDAAEAVDQVNRGEADVAFLMNPVTLDELREVAFAGEVLPQKSTDFFPKLLSGLAIYALD